MVLDKYNFMADCISDMAAYDHLFPRFSLSAERKVREKDLEKAAFKYWGIDFTKNVIDGDTLIRGHRRQMCLVYPAVDIAVNVMEGLIPENTIHSRLFADKESSERHACRQFNLYTLIEAARYCYLTRSGIISPDFYLLSTARTVSHFKLEELRKLFEIERTSFTLNRLIDDLEQDEINKLSHEEEDLFYQKLLKDLPEWEKMISSQPGKEADGVNLPNLEDYTTTERLKLIQEMFGISLS